MDLIDFVFGFLVVDFCDFLGLYLMFLICVWLVLSGVCVYGRVDGKVV